MTLKMQFRLGNNDRTNKSDKLECKTLYFLVMMLFPFCHGDTQITVNTAGVWVITVKSQFRSTNTECMIMQIEANL